MPAQAAQARSHHARQALIAAAAVKAVTAEFNRGSSWDQILNLIASYQMASAEASIATMAGLNGQPASVAAAPFAGVSSAGFSITEPLIATIDSVIPAPVEPLPAPWWDDAAKFMDQVAQLIESEVQDAGRSAFGAELYVGPVHENYVRVLVPPSCKRCVVLAGRVYRDNEGFERHPQCDCVHWPVKDWEEAHDLGLVMSPREAFDKGVIRDLTKAEEQAIADGADISTVINSASGISTADLFGKRVKVTSYGTTKRSAWRKANPSRPVRLRPESIYRIARDREDAIRLLTVYGYIT